MHSYSLQELIHTLFYTGLKRDGIRAIFWGNAIRQFAAAAVGLFIPVYVYQVGYEQQDGSFVSGMRTLLLFLLLARVAAGLSSLAVEQLIDRIGFRWTLLVSSVLLSAKFVLLTIAGRNLVFLWIAALLSGLVTSTYWISRHALFGEDQDTMHVGTSLGLLVFLSQVVTVIGPLVGGFVTAMFGFLSLFRLGLVLAVSSGIPFFFMRHHRRHHPDGVAGMVEKLKDPMNFPLVVSWIGRSWDEHLIIDFWPLYVFLVVGAVEKLGIISAAVAGISMIASYAAGLLFDRRQERRKMFLLGAGVSAAIWPVRAFARSFWPLLSIDALHNLVYPAYWVPFLSQTYQFSFRKDTVAFFAFRELVWSVGLIGFLILAFLLTVSWSWGVLFLLGTFGTLVSMSLVFYRGFH